MKRGTLIAIAILIILVGIFFATRKGPETTVEAPYTIAKVDNLDRIEVTRPGDADALVVLTRKDGTWTLSKPVEAPLADAVAREIEGVFAKAIATDDLKVATSKLAEYELDDNAAKVSLYSSGATEPSKSFSVGKEMTVASTRARRSFILTDSGRAYRARTSLQVLRKPVKDLRSKVVVKADRDAVTSIKITRGADILTLNKGEKGWTTDGAELDMSAVNGLIGALTNLTATDFADTAKLAEVGLQPAVAVVEALVGDETITLSVGSVGADYFVKREGVPFVYKIAPFSGKALDASIDTLRNKTPKSIDQATITAIQFGGEDRVWIEKTGEAWAMKRPSKTAVPTDKITGLLGAVGGIRALRYARVSDTDAGLQKPESTIVIQATDGTHTLSIGAAAEAGKEDRYARWDDKPELVFVLPKTTVDRLMPKAAALTGQP